MGRPASPPSLSRFLFGLAVVAVGVLFALQNLGWTDVGRFFRWLGRNWPVVFVAIGISHLFGKERSWLGALIWISIGAVLLAPEPIRDQALELVFRFWPLGLVLLGLGIVAKALRGERPAGRPGRRGGAAAADTSPRVGAFAILSSRQLRNASPAFEGGDLTACLGGCELDLRRAELGGEAVIETFAFWGGVEIIVPETWSVDLRVFPFMGGAEDATRPPKVPTGEQLVVKGVAFMGGVSVRN